MSDQICVYCGDEVKPDRKGHLWAADLNDGQPLWCETAPDKRHALQVPDSGLDQHYEAVKNAFPDAAR